MGPDRESPVFPIVLAVIAMGLLTAMDGLVKVLAARYPVVDVVTLRYAAGALTILPVLIWERPRWPDRAGVRTHAIRAGLIAATSLFHYTALSRLPIAEAVGLRYLGPVLMALLARMFLQESVKASMAVSLALGIVGCVVVAGGKELGGQSASGDLIGVAAAILGTLTYAGAMVILRARSNRDPVVMMVALQNGFAVAYALPAAVSLGDPGLLALGHWPMLLAIGALGTTGHLMLTTAFKHAPTARVAPLEYTSFAWAVLIGMVFLGEQVSLTTLAGTALIVCSSLLLLRPARR